MLISKIHCTLSANKKRVTEFNVSLLCFADIFVSFSLDGIPVTELARCGKVH